MSKGRKGGLVKKGRSRRGRDAATSEVAIENDFAAAEY
jgi:hypothetical protein